VLGPPFPPQQWHLVEETGTFIRLLPPSLQSVNCLFHVRERKCILKKENVLKIRKMYKKYKKCIKNTKNVLKIRKMY
jgi:hypothetical protein